MNPINAKNALLTVDRVPENRLEEIWPICTDLALSMSYPSFFCTGDWLKTCAESIEASDALLILTVKQGEILLAVLPLVSKRNKLGGKDLRFLGTDYYPDPIGLICAPSSRVSCATALKEYLLKISGWDRLILDWILEEELIDWGLPGKQISVEPYKLLPRNFNDLLETFKQKKRYNMRSGVRKLLNANAELVISNTSSAHKFFFENLCDLHQKRALERELDSSFIGPKIDKFHSKLINQSENTRFYGLQMNNKLIAVIYGFEFCNRFFYYQVAHDPAFKDAGPGSVLLFLVIEDCCTRGVTEFNFLQGNESYKSVWTDESRLLYRVVFNKGTCRSSLLNSLEQGKSLVKKGLVRMRHGT